MPMKDRDQVRHRHSRALREFKALTTDEKLEAIYLNSEETNGNIVEAWDAIAAIVERLKPLEAAAAAAQQVAEDGLAVGKFTKKWGAVGSALLVALGIFAGAGQAIGLWDRLWQLIGW